MQDSQQNMFDVVYTDSNGNIKYYLRGATLDYAQAAKDYITANGVTVERTGSDGFFGGAKTTESVTNVRVVRSPRRGEASVTEVTEELSVTSATSGLRFYAELANNFTPGSVSATVNASGAPIVGVEELSNDDIVIFLKTGEALTTTDAVSATYSYKTSENIVAVTDEDHDSDVDGAATTFELDHVFMYETVSITTSASGNISLLEGGGKYIEVLANGAALPLGSTLKVSYQYGPQDDTAVPSEESFPWDPPSWVGDPQTPPFNQ